MLSLDQEDINRFGKILRMMNLDKVSEFASTVRRYGHGSIGSSPKQDLTESCLIECDVVNPPLCGSFHIVFPIKFADGVKWMLKIPANGDRFESIAAASMASEAHTMQMLKRETGIPVPAVYAFDTTPQNAIRSPFILMEKLEGRPLFHSWFDPRVPKARLEHFRVKVLQNLAGIMVQMNKFTTNAGGSLVFNGDGVPIGLNGAKVMDGVAIFNNFRGPLIQQRDREKRDGMSPRLCVEDDVSNTQQATGHIEADGDESDDGDIICERGPFIHPKAYFMSHLDRPDPAFRADAYERGTDMCLRLFIKWAFAESRNHERPFVLTHPDLDVQNILVSEDGTITGLIDWDGVAAVPREVGCAQYPLWLMRDWVPSRYQYDIEKGQPFADAGYTESSPAELASYRAIYAQFMEAEIGKMTGGRNRTTTFGTLPEHEANITRRSLVMRSLDLSVGDPYAALQNVNHIIDQIEELTIPGWEGADMDIGSMPSCLTLSDSDSAMDYNRDEEKKDLGAPETNEQGLYGYRDDFSTRQADQGVGSMDHSVRTAAVKVYKSAREAAHQGQVSSVSDEPFPIGDEKPKAQNLSKTDIQDNLPTSSASANWTRRFLRLGCNTAERCLRRISDIGHALIGAVDKTAEILAEFETQHDDTFEDLLPIKRFDVAQQVTAIEYSENIGKSHFTDIPLTGSAGGSEQANDPQVPKPNAVLQEVSSAQAVDNAEHIVETSSIQSTVDPQDVALRKAELLHVAGVRVEKEVVQTRTVKNDASSGTFEFILEDLAEKHGIESSVDNVSLQNPVIRTQAISVPENSMLHIFEDNKDELESPAAIPTTMQSQSELYLGRNSRTSKPNGGSRRAKPSAAANADRLSSVSVSEDHFTSEPDIPPIAPNNDISPDRQDLSEEDQMVVETNLEQMDKIFDEEAIGNLANIVELELLLGAPSRFGDDVLSNTSKAAYSLRALSEPGTSHFTQIFYSCNQSQEYSEDLSPDSSVRSDKGNDESRNDDRDTRSSVSSLSDGEVENRHNEDEDEPLNTSEFAAAEGNDGQSVEDKINKECVKDAREKDGRAESSGQTNQAGFTKGSFKTEEATESSGTRKIYGPCNGDWADANEFGETTNAGSATKTGSSTAAENLIYTDITNSGGGMDSEGHHNHEAAENADEKFPWDVEIPEFEDHGGFDRYTVCNLLGMGQLDELRLLRLKEGFSMLLERY